MSLSSPSTAGITSILRAYQSANRTLRHTSRANNANWYRRSADMPVQWHIATDGNQLRSEIWVEKDKAWYRGPEITLEQLQSPSQEYVDQAVPPILQAIKGKKDRALGIILHLSDLIKLAEIRSEFSEEKDFNALDDLVRLAPSGSISGSQINQEESSWALLPYWGESVTGRNAVALQVGNQFQLFVEMFSQWGETHNTPVNVSVTCAPLETLAQLPIYVPHLADQSAGASSGCIAILRYHSVTFLAAFNLYGELCSARVLPNQEPGGLPPDLEWLIKSFAAAEDIEKPRICLLDLADRGNDTSGIDFESIGYEFLNISPWSKEDELRGIPIEFLNTRNSRERFSALNEKLSEENKTFHELLGHWAQQNVYSLECQNINRFPSQRELHALKGSRLFRLTLFVAIPAIVGWGLMSTLKTTAQPYWKIDQAKISAAAEKLRSSEGEKKEIQYWENLMASRSEGWVVLSTILDLFPEGEEIFLTDCKFGFHALPPDKKGKYLPMRQTWSIKGFATQKGINYLTSLSSKAPMMAKFNEIAKKTESPAYQSDEKTRTLKVLLEQKQAPMPSSAIVSRATARLYRRGFELQIDREFSDKDALALQIANPFKQKSSKNK